MLTLETQCLPCCKSRLFLNNLFDIVYLKPVIILEHSKATILLGFPKVLGEMATIFFKTECHWKTEQRATVGIPNVLGITAPNVVVLYFQRLLTL